jgi:hypothetical protein
MVCIVRRPFRNLKIKASAFLLFAAIACVLHSTSAQTPGNPALDSIRSDELREKLTYFASDKFKGRGNGTPELKMAADYIARVFESNGLGPANGVGRYFQSFEMYSARLGPANDVRFHSSRDGESKLKFRSDFIPEQWSLSGVASGRLIYVEPHSEVQNLAGHIAVVPEGQGLLDDPEFPENAAIGLNLQKAGAAAVIIVQDLTDPTRGRIANLAETFRADLPTRQTAMGVVDSPEYPKIPVVVVSSEVGRQLVATLKAAQTKIEATITVDVQRKTFRTQNVLGLLEGSDPNLKREVMIVGAHYDHDGQANGQIWYGADDDGSGTVALLELAEAFEKGPRPARSVLLCAWAGEEKGLLGSRYYATHPTFPLKNTVAMFQMDMIGRDEDHAANPAQDVPEEHAADNVNTVNVLGSSYSPDLRTIISRSNELTSLGVRFRYDVKAEDLLRRSDQWSFLAKGVPAVFFFAGLHPDYHTPRDTAAKINYAKLEKVVRLVYLSAFELANNPMRPQYIPRPATQN